MMRRKIHKYTQDELDEDPELAARLLKETEAEIQHRRYGQEDGFHKTLASAIRPTLTLCEEAARVAGFCDDSPIERMFATMLQTVLVEAKQAFRFCTQEDEVNVTHSSGELLIIPQFKWKRWRYDFAYKCPPRPRPVVFVECDGKQFHSRMHQMQNDWRKDDEAEDNDIRIVRFKGAEIYKNARACVIKSLEAL